MEFLNDIRKINNTVMAISDILPVSVLDIGAAFMGMRSISRAPSTFGIPGDCFLAGLSDEKLEYPLYSVLYDAFWDRSTEDAYLREPALEHGMAVSVMGLTLSEKELSFIREHMDYYFTDQKKESEVAALDPKRIYEIGDSVQVSYLYII